MTKLNHKIKLTKAQGIIYAAILDYFDEYEQSPTMSEIVEYSGYSQTTVVYRVPELVSLGLITKQPNRTRSIELTDIRLPGFEAPEPEPEPAPDEEAPWKSYDDNPRI